MGYSLSLQKGYQVADLSVVYPIARGTGPMLSSIGAFILLGEPVRPLGILGILLVVMGILLIATQGHLRRFFSPAALTGVRWGMQTGILIAACKYRGRCLWCQSAADLSFLPDGSAMCCAWGC